MISWCPSHFQDFFDLFCLNTDHWHKLVCYQLSHATVEQFQNWTKVEKNRACKAILKEHFPTTCLSGNVFDLLKSKPKAVCGPHRSWNWQTIFGVKTIVGSNLTNKLCFWRSDCNGFLNILLSGALFIFIWSVNMFTYLLAPWVWGANFPLTKIQS